MSPVHSRRMLGRLPEDPDRPKLMLADFLKSPTPLPVIPGTDDLTDVDPWYNWANDSIGDCGPEMLAHSRLQVSKDLGGAEQVIDSGQVVKFYSAVSGYDEETGDNDDGVVLQEMFSVAQKVGIAGKKPLAYARVDHTNTLMMKAAVAIFGGAHLGVTLQVAQQAQTDSGLWDYKPSGIWGGHAVYLAGYKPRRMTVVTWGEEVDYTDAFGQYQVDEAWVVIWEEHLGDHRFLQNIDANALKDAYHTLTGKDLPVPTPPEPPEPPGPEPTPPLPPAPSSSVDVDTVAIQLAAETSRLTGEPANQHTHRNHSRRRVFVCGGFEVEIHDLRR